MGLGRVWSGHTALWQPVIDIAGGQLFSAALRSDGSIVAWGNNDYGQLDVPSGNDFVAVAAGAAFSMALRSDGTIAAWGDNDYGQCNIPWSDDGYVDIAAGYFHGLAIVPEPGTILLLGLGGLLLRRRRK